MAAENVGFRELKYWELMSRMGRKAAIRFENTFLPVRDWGSSFRLKSRPVQSLYSKHGCSRLQAPEKTRENRTLERTKALI